MTSLFWLPGFVSFLFLFFNTTFLFFCFFLELNELVIFILVILCYISVFASDSFKIIASFELDLFELSFILIIRCESLLLLKIVKG